MHHKNTMLAMHDIDIVIAHRPDYDQYLQRLQALKYELTPNGETAVRHAPLRGGMPVYP